MVIDVEVVGAQVPQRLFEPGPPLGRRDPAVVFDFTGLSRITSSIRALLGVLRLQAHHYGTTIELRNLAPEFSAALAEPRAMASMAMDG